MAKLAPPLPVVSEVRLLESLSYLERRTGIRRRMPGQYPRFFYKFRSADLKDENARLARLRSYFVDSHLWLSHHESFNDPFDMKAHIFVGGSREEKEARFKALIADHSGATWKKRREMLRNWMATDPDKAQLSTRKGSCHSTNWNGAWQARCDSVVFANG